MSEKKDFKVTYTTTDPAGLDAFHESYDEAVKNVRSQLGRSYPMFIGGKRITGFEEFRNISPTDTGITLGYFQKGLKGGIRF